MRLVVTGLLLAMVVVSCTEAPRHDSLAVRNSDSLLLSTRCDLIDEKGVCTLWGPSLVELIARPETYDGKRVRLIGFVNFELEGNAIYLSAEDWKHGVSRNSLWINPPQGFESDSGPAAVQPNRRYVIVEGTFNAKNRGHMGLRSGAIENLTRLDPWGDWHR